MVAGDKGEQIDRLMASIKDPEERAKGDLDLLLPL